MKYSEKKSIRVDKYIAKIKEEYSRNQIQNHLEKGNILVNEKIVKPSYKLQIGDEIDIDIPEKKPYTLIPEADMKIDILYEDDDILVISKEAGQVVHPAPGHKEGTLVHGLIGYTDKLSSVGSQFRPGIVHRLDKDTAGLLVIARNNEAHRYLQEQWKLGKVTREYGALVQGRVGEARGTIDTYYGRNPRDRQKMAVRPSGRRAITHYQVESYHNHFTYVKAQLETGRTHQIRVHMASIHHPILGDDLYGPKRQIHNLPFQALAAIRLGFNHPRTKEYIEFTGRLPEYMERLLQIEDSQ